MKAQNINLKPIQALLPIILSVAAFLFSILTFSGVTIKPQKVAYVKTDEVFQKFKGMQEAKTAFQTKANTWQDNIDTLKQELELAIKSYETERLRLSEKTRLEREAALRKKQEELAQYTQTLNQQAEQEDRKLTESVVKQINAYMEEYGKKHGYSIILGANGNGSVVYGAETIDITEELIAALNKSYEGR